MFWKKVLASAWYKSFDVSDHVEIDNESPSFDGDCKVEFCGGRESVKQDNICYWGQSVHHFHLSSSHGVLYRQAKLCWTRCPDAGLGIRMLGSVSGC